MAALALATLITCSVYDTSLLPAANAAGGQSGGNSLNQGGAASTGGAGGAGGTFTGDAGMAGNVESNGGTGGSIGNGGDANGGSLSGGTASGGTLQGGTAAGGTAQGGGGQAGGNGGSPTLLFSDDFEKGVINWTTNTVNDWNLTSDTSTAYEESALSNVFRAATAGDDEWTDQSVEVKIKVATFGGTTTSYFAGVFARYVDDDNNYCLAVRGDGKYSIRRRLAGTSGSIGPAFNGIPFQSGTWHTFKLEVVGSTLNAYIDGVLFQTQNDTSFSKGRIGIGTTNASARFDDVRVLKP
jgi:hypothetical protein